jgi:hypothetical protein
MSVRGPSRHFAAGQQLGRFRSEADIEPVYGYTLDLIVLKLPHATDE